MHWHLFLRQVAEFIGIAFLLTVRPTVGLKANSWPIKFRQNAQTLPSIEVKLSPPDDPLPQVTAEVLLLERSRLELEEGLMAKLEDEYNTQLDNAQTQISAAVERAMSIFNNPDILQGAIRGAMLPRVGEETTGGGAAARFQQMNDSADSRAFRSPSVSHMRGNGPLRSFSSFLQTGETVRSENKIVGDIMAAALAPPPAVKLQLTEVNEPDPQIKEKMDEIEQLRADEETKMFDQAMMEFGQLTQITVAGLEENIQLQLNPFLVDKAAVKQALKQSAAAAAGIAAATAPAAYTPTPLAFKQEEKIKQNKQLMLHDRRSPSSFLQLTSSSAASSAATATAAAAAAAAAAAKQQTKFGLTTEKQLNVKITQAEKPYPTVDEIVSEMQKKRDATERLERMKILQLQMKLLRAEGEMIKEALHSNVARILAQLAPAIEAIKAEAAVRALS